jgi:elongation factor Ts
MSISAKDVKRLRDMTGVGMMDCKQALEEADGDFDKAVEVLRKKGQKVAAKRADREANEGLIVSALSTDHRTGAMAEVNCETDFVARNEEFGDFAKEVVQLVLANKPETLEDLNEVRMKNGTTVPSCRAIRARSYRTSTRDRASACSSRCTETDGRMKPVRMWPCRSRP